MRETPKGAIQQVYKNGWCVEHWLKSPEDYRIMVHYDGTLSVIADEIAGTPFHVIESLTKCQLN
jgi:hypothetical protein